MFSQLVNKNNVNLTSILQNCENILTKLIYEIHHDGNDGIKEVQVLIEMTNFSPRLTYPEDHVVFTQTFGYNHYWSSDNVTSTLKEKSGNPGYLGKMLLRTASCYNLLITHFRSKLVNPLDLE